MSDSLLPTLTRCDQMYEAALKFHAERPEVWELFVAYTLDRIAKGASNYGACGIWERIRWDSPIAADGTAEWKLSNNHRTFYARWFAEEYPEHADFFRMRKQTSEDMPASTSPELTPADYPYINDKRD